MDREHLSVREYAARYGVSAAPVYAMIARGALPHVNLGVGRGTIRIPTDALPTAAAPATASAVPASPRPRLNHLRV